MNARINLLPHREERRKRARQHFVTVAGGTAIVGIALAFLMYQYYAAADRDAERPQHASSPPRSRSSTRTSPRSTSCSDEIQALLARKQVIETLQADRAQTVHLLEQLVRQMPEGVYLKSMRADRRRRCTSSAMRSRTRASRR